MKAKEKIIPGFLTGGGEMGELTRQKDWHKTALGNPENWPQSLRTTLSIVLNSKFPMFLFWGKDLTQFYNDAYRPSLGNDGKHPTALGQNGEDCWPEIWPVIKPLIDQVLDGGEATWSEDQLIPIYRNGKMENVYWTFSYSPVKIENGEVGAVLVTVIETTEKINNFKKIAESNDQLNFAIEATELGTWDFNPLTNKFTGNNRLKDWFGLPHNAEIDLSIAIEVVAEKDRSPVVDAIQKALQYESGGLYDIEYDIINALTKQERIVRAKGRAWFGEDKMAYRFNGTLQDITTDSIAKKKIEESEQRLSNERLVLYNSFMNAPAGIAILKGDTHIYEFANAEYEKLVDRKIPSGKTIQELFPEIEQQGLIDILDNVFSTGQPFIANEFPVELIDKRTGKPVVHYYNSVIQPIKDEKGNTERLLTHAVEVTQQVKARKQIEANEQRFGAAVEAVQGILWTNNAKGEMEGEQKGWAALTGQSYDEYQGYGWATVVHPDDAQPTIDAWNEAVKELKIFVFEHRVKTKSGEWELFSIKAIPLLNEDGSIREWIGVHTNITVQKEAEEKIKASEERYRSLFESMDQGFCIIELIFDSNNNPVDYLFIEANPAFEKQSGIADPVGKTIRAFFPNLKEHWFKIYSNVALTGEAKHFIDYIEGLSRWFEVSAFRLGDTGSKKVAVLFTNINERKQNEETLRYSKALLEAHNEANRDGLLLVDAKGKIISYNQSFIDVWRMPKEIVETKDDELALQFAMSQLVNPQQFIEKVKWLYEHPSETSIDELEYLDGRIIERHGYSVLGEDGTYYAWSWTFRDITGQKAAAAAIIESESRFRTMAEATEVLIEVSDENSNVTYFNKAWVDLTGRPMEDLLKLGWADLLHPEDKDPVLTIYHSSFAKQEGYTVEFRILNKYGEYRWLLAKAPPRFHPDGIFAGYISACVDITEQKRFSEELEKQVKERTEELQTANLTLENSNSELASFNYIASHDLQEPLRKIQTFGRRIIETENFSDKTQDYFNRIIAAGERMQNLIISLLDFSHANNTELIFEPCDLNTIVEESKNDLQISILEKQASIEYENLPTINGVRLQLSQLFTNLIDNAIKYSHPEIKPHIKITSSIIEGKISEHTSANKQKNYHAIQFADNGIGFEQEYENKIFELFQRLHGKNEYSGTGIGLGIVKKIVTNHNGFIVAKGKPNIGATFTIYIPTT